VSLKNKKRMIKTKRYIKKIFITLILGFVAVFFVNAEGNIENSSFSNLSDSSDVSTLSSENIEDYNIAGYFEFEQTGNASWYGRKFHNRKTASGERYNMHELTAAHKKLPMGAIVRVINQQTDERVLLKINDRGPYVKTRIIDLSYHSAQHISGATNPKVKVETLLAEDNYDILPEDKEYFFGFSYDFPLVCIPGSVINFLTYTDDFDKAVNFYKKTLEENPGQLVYLFTNAGAIDYSYNNLKEKYYIGIFRPELIESSNDLVKN